MRAVESGSALRITISGLVDTFDEITSALKFNGQIKRRRDVDALKVNARLVCATGSTCGIAQSDVDIPISIDVTIINKKHGETFARFTRREAQRAGSEYVVSLLLSVPIASGVVHGCNSRCIAQA